MITHLEWDSNFFKQKIGKVETNRLSLQQLEVISKEKQERGYDLIYIFANSIGKEEIKNMEENGARLVDQKVTYHKLLGLPAPNALVFEKFEGPVTADLLELALASGHKSRFRKDPGTKPYFEELYRTWIENSVNKIVADEVLVCKQNGLINGFVTLRKNGDAGSIGLIAVDKKSRGMGIGKALLIASDNWYLTHQCKSASVVTQKDNDAACILYEKAGYKLFTTQYIFHY